MNPGNEANGWERPPEYDDPPDRDCLSCGYCEWCIERSIAAAEEADDHEEPMPTHPEPVPASINAAAKLWVVNSGTFEPEPDRPSWGVFWEPLSVRLGPDAKPHCCYTQHVAFYDRSGNKLLADLVQCYAFMGLHPHLLLLAGKWREVVGGRVEFHAGQWHMRWQVASNTKWARKLNGEGE